MANTFIKIASVTVGSGGAATIDFTSIPSTYTDLQLVFTARNTGSSNVFTQMTFNGNSSSYSYRGLFGNGSSASSFTASAAYIYVGDMVLSTYTANTFSSESVYVPNYAGSNNKSVSIDSVNENNATAAADYLTAALWSNSAAIDRITLTPGGGSYAQYSTAVLYGIKNS
jgi:hypothetical protein